MKITISNTMKTLITLSLFLFVITVQGQDSIPKPKNNFWKKVTFIPSIGLGFGSGFTNISVAPAAVYNINKYFSAGMGLQYSYLNQKNAFESSTYGGSLIGFVNPAEFIQISAEVEQLRANVNNELFNTKADFWNTALFVGAGLRYGNSVIGARYNVLYNEGDGVYGNALIPFIRIGF